MSVELVKDMTEESPLYTVLTLHSPLPSSSAELSLTPVRPASYSTAPPSSGD